MTTYTAQLEEQDLPLQRIYHWEKVRGDKTFLTQPLSSGGIRRYTWAEAVGEARKVAAHLLSLNLSPGSRIAIMSKNCAQWIIADFAIWMAGHVSVPLYPTLTTESVRKILEHSGSQVLFMGKLDAWGPMIAGIPAGVDVVSFSDTPSNRFRSWDEIVAMTKALAQNPVRPRDALATIIYTSGTTGHPKGVMHSFGNLGLFPKLLQRISTANENDRSLSYLPLAHAAERMTVQMMAIRSGMQLFFTKNLETFAEDLRRARPTLFFSVPRLWVKFQQGVSAKIPEAKLQRMLSIPLIRSLVRRKVLKALGLGCVRMAGSGAAPLPEAVMRWYRGLGLELLEGYGMTEVCGLSHMCRPGQVRIGYVGPTLGDVSARLSSEGEIQIRTPVATQGYYNDPVQTEALFTPDGFVRTGDKGVIDASGRLRLTGRIKELFKTSKGKYVAPAPIENKITEHHAVEACCVVGANQPQPCALLMPSPEARASSSGDGRAAFSVSLEFLLAEVNKTLDDHEKLAFLVVVGTEWSIDDGFLTPTLKIKRDVVENYYAPFIAQWYERGEKVIWE